MAYVDPDFKTKKEFKAAVAWSQKYKTYEEWYLYSITTDDYPIRKYQPPLIPYNPGMNFPINDGFVGIEGPHFPKPHRWYASVRVKDGVVVEVK